MDVAASPGLDEPARAALLEALQRTDVDLTGSPTGVSAWRRAGLVEAVERDVRDGYAFSPRSTRGATRA